VPGEVIEYDGCWWQCTDSLNRWDEATGTWYSDEATLLYCGGVEPTPTPTVMPTITPTVTPTVTPISWSPMDYIPTPPIPGFEAVFAIIGLIGVAYLLLKTEE